MKIKTKGNCWYCRGNSRNRQGIEGVSGTGYCLPRACGPDGRCCRPCESRQH